MCLHTLAAHSGHHSRTPTVCNDLQPTHNQRQRWVIGSTKRSTCIMPSDAAKSLRPAAAAVSAACACSDAFSRFTSSRA